MVSDVNAGGIRQKFEIWCPATLVADWHFDQLRRWCQRSTKIDEGASGRNDVWNPCHIYISSSRL